MTTWDPIDPTDFPDGMRPFFRLAGFNAIIEALHSEYLQTNITVYAQDPHFSGVVKRIMQKSVVPYNPHTRAHEDQAKDVITASTLLYMAAWPFAVSAKT